MFLVVLSSWQELRRKYRKKIHPAKIQVKFWLEFYSTVSAVTLKFGQIPQNLVGVLSCPGVADMQTPLKSANMLQAIMYI